MTYDVGIDVGTTFTAAAISRGGAVEPVALTTSRVTVPSVVFASGDELLFGGAAERRGAAEPTGLAREFKRRVGDPVPLMLSGSPFHADRLTALMANWVGGTVTEQLGGPPNGSVFTHPANWTEYQLGTLRNALADVGLGHAELISEPAAAAIDYAAVSEIEAGTSLLVYDLGGGTFDVALLRREGARFEHVVEPAGIERLGGIDFDEAVFQFAMSRLPGDVLERARQNPEGAAGLTQLKRRCVEAKEALSSDAVADIPVLLPDHTSTIRITRGEFEAMIRPSIDQTIELVKRTVERAGLAREELHATLLVGGSSRIPLVSQLVGEELGVRVRVDAHPKLVTARGAARMAGTGAGRPRPGATPRRQRADGGGSGSRKPLLIGAGVLVAAAAVVGGVLAFAGGGDDDPDSSPSAPSVAATTAGTTAATVAATAGDGTATPATVPSTDPATTPSSTAPPTTVAPFRPFAVASNIATLPNPIDIELVGTDLWVMSEQAGTLQRFDVTLAQPTALDSVPLGFTAAEGRNGNDVVHVDGALYVTQQGAGTVARVQLDALGEPPQRLPVTGSPFNAALRGTTLWVTTHAPDGSPEPGYLVPIDTVTRTVGTPVPMPEAPYGIAVAGDEVWVTFDDVDRVGRVDLTSGEVQFVEGLEEPVDLLPLGDELWVTLAGRDSVAVIDRESAIVRRFAPVGFTPFKLAASAGSVWVTNAGNGTAPGTLSRLDPTSRDASALQDPIELELGPIELAATDDRLFVANYGSASVSVLVPS